MLSLQTTTEGPAVSSHLILHPQTTSSRAEGEKLEMLSPSLINRKKVLKQSEYEKGTVQALTFSVTLGLQRNLQNVI